MTTFHLHFAGKISKVEHRQAGDKAIAEVSLCRKRKTKDGEPEAWDWIRATIWQPSEFTTPKLIKGAFISGHGDLSTRTFTNKEGKEVHSLEVRCGTYDVEVSGDAAPAPAAPAPTPRRPVAPADTEDPPF